MTSLSPCRLPLPSPLSPSPFSPPPSLLFLVPLSPPSLSLVLSVCPVSPWGSFARCSVRNFWGRGEEGGGEGRVHVLHAVTVVAYSGHFCCGLFFPTGSSCYPCSEGIDVAEEFLASPAVSFMFLPLLPASKVHWVPAVTHLAASLSSFSRSPCPSAVIPVLIHALQGHYRSSADEIHTSTGN